MNILYFFIITRVLFDGYLKLDIYGQSITYILPIIILIYSAKYFLFSKRFLVSIYFIFTFLLISSFLGQSYWGNGGLEELIRTFSIIGILIISISSNANFSTFAFIVSSMGVLSALFSIWQFIFGVGMNIEGINRCQGLMAHPNSAALLYGSSIILMLTTEISSHRNLRIFKFSLLIFSLIFTFSISGILVTVLGFFFREHLINKRVDLRIFAILIFASLSLIAFKFIPQIKERANLYTQSSRSQTRTEANSLEWRFARWKEILKYWEKAPIFGQGYGSTTNGAMLSGYMPHNEYVRLLVELGIFGLIFFLVLYLILYRRLSSIDETNIKICAQSLLFMSAVSALTENTFLYTVHAYILAAVVGFALKSQSGRKVFKSSDK